MPAGEGRAIFRGIHALTQWTALQESGSDWKMGWKQFLVDQALSPETMCLAEQYTSQGSKKGQYIQGLDNGGGESIILIEQIRTFPDEAARRRGSRLRSGRTAGIVRAVARQRRWGALTSKGQPYWCPSCRKGFTRKRVPGWPKSPGCRTRSEKRAD